MAFKNIFEDNCLMKNSFSAFHDMKRTGEFCDITIKFGSRTISAHRNVIAGVMPYFRKKLTNQSNEADLNGITGYYDLDADALESLIEFSYTGRISLTTDNVKALLPTASFLGVDPVIDACCKFIVSQMKVEEVLSERQYAVGVNSSELLESINSYVWKNFDEVSISEIFLDAPFSCVKEVICAQDLKTSKEENVLNFVMKWVKKSPEEREVYLAELLSKVRMAFVHPDYLTDVFEEDLIVSSIPCRNILRDARTYHFFPHRRAQISSFDTTARGSAKQRPKNDESWTPGIYAIWFLPQDRLMYYDTQPQLPAQSLQYFDPAIKKWNIVDVLSFTLHSANSSLIQRNGKLYFYNSDYIRAYDPKSLASENSFYVGQRFNAGITVSKNKLYICGGTVADDPSPLVTVISFDFQTKSTGIIDNIPFRGTHLGAVALNDDSLYVLGGKDENGKYLNSVWLCNVPSRRWTEVASMNYQRCAMGCAMLDGKIYVCGGITSNNNNICSTEVFDPLTNKWLLLSNMRSPRFGFSLISYDGKLYAVGGRRRGGTNFHSFDTGMDIYDPTTNKWDSCSPLPKSTTFVKATSIEQAPT